MRESILVITPVVMYGGSRIEFSWWGESGVEIVDLPGDSVEHIVETRILSALESGAPGVILNLEKVTHMGSAFVEVLLRWRQATLDHEKQLVLAAADGRLQEIFGITKIASLLDCYKSVSEAAEHLNSMNNK